jgi:putative PIN family toxin of toxin-antitoxin system
MKIFKVVIDTNVIFSGLFSSRGKSYKLLQLLGNKNIEISISIALLLEYEEILKRNLKKLGFSKTDIEDFLDYICNIANKRNIYFLWRPFLKDIKDDMVLELAVESESDFIVTHNIKDFTRAKEFGIKAITPNEFLKIMEKSK